MKNTYNLLLKLYIFSLFLILCNKATASELVNYCVSLKPKIEFNYNLDLNNNFFNFENAYLPLFNFDNILNLSPKSKDILTCKQHLAQQTSSFLLKLKPALTLTADNNDAKFYLNVLKNLAYTQLTEDDKNKLYTTKVAIYHEMAKSKVTYNIDATKCIKLTNSNLPLYLQNETNQDCKEAAWSAYMTHASSKIAPLLKRMQTINKNIALKHDVDYLDYLLKPNFLDKKQLVNFLNLNTHNIHIAPWDIFQVLDNTPKTNVDVTQKSFLLKYKERLKQLNINFEFIEDKNWRVWSNKRLLGEVMIEDGSPLVTLIKRPVVGRQFGLFKLTLPKSITSYTSLQNSNDAVASLISLLLSPRKYYLANSFSDTFDTKNILANWLSLYLLDAMQIKLDTNSREAILANYQMQYKIYQTKVALNIYSKEPMFDLDYEFKRSFNEKWSKVQLAPYSFQAAIINGPNLYAEIWQKYIAKRIYEHNKNYNKTFTQLQNGDYTQLVKKYAN